MSGYMAGAQLAEELAKTKIVRSVSSAVASTAVSAAATFATGNPAVGTYASYAVSGAKVAAPNAVEEVAAQIGGVVAATGIAMVGSVLLPFFLVAWALDEL